jgi:hypothetical protein
MEQPWLPPSVGAGDHFLGLLRVERQQGRQNSRTQQGAKKTESNSELHVGPVRVWEQASLRLGGTFVSKLADRRNVHLFSNWLSSHRLTAGRWGRLKVALRDGFRGNRFIFRQNEP